MNESNTPTPEDVEPSTEETLESIIDQARGDLPPTPAQFHEQLIDQFRATLDGEGEKAYDRWGLTLLFSLEDAQLEAQREALGFKPQDALDYYNRGCLLAQREQFADAAKAFGKATELDPELPEADYNYALALELAGQKGPARKAWMAHLDKFADSADVAEIKQHLTALVDE